MTKSLRPNVILISTDQQRGDCIGPEGRGAKTPHLDALAANGARFTKCITPHPMCQAARASILTGKLPYSHGVRDNGRDLDESFAAQGMAGIFAGAGYDTRFIGKAHFSSQQTFDPTGKPECYVSAKDYDENWHGEYFGFDHVQLLLRPHHHTRWAAVPEALHYERWLDRDGDGKARWEKAQIQLEPKTAHFQCWRSDLEEPHHSTAWVGDKAIDMIENATEQPVFSWISFPDPHPPFLAPKPWCDMYSRDDVAISAAPLLDLDNRPWWHRAFVEARDRTKAGAHFNAGGVDWGAKGDLTPEALGDLTAIYFGMISAVDHQIGRILEAIDNAGMRDNTIIGFISDHGEWLGDHGLLLKGPMLYDGLLRVPMIMSGPGVPKDTVINQPVSTLDLRSTLTDMCGLDAAKDDGASLRELFAGGSRDYALNEYEVDAKRSAVDLDLRTVRSDRYRFSVDLNTDTGELYDMTDDPLEMHNLFDDPSQLKVRRDHMDMIRARPNTIIPAAPRVGWH